MCQPEIGEDGTPHIQGVLVFRNAKFFSELHNVDSAIHWEKARNLMACRNYCSKLKTQAGTVWTKGFAVAETVKDPLAGKELYGWQKEIVKLCEEDADDRKVFWYWSEAGNIGKSALCKHMCLTLDRCYVLGGKFKDAMYAIDQMVNKHKKPPYVLVFDVPRSMIKDGYPMVSYHTMEKIKDGCFFSSKYESQQVLFNTPHVVVFANCAPDMTKLSSDRWEVKTQYWNSN